MKKPNVKHYNRLNPEPIEVINLFRLNFNLGSAIKYLARAGYKDLEAKDVQKAIDFLNFELEYQTQKYSETKILTDIDLNTLWEDCFYRTEIIIILLYVKSPKVRSLSKKSQYHSVIRSLQAKLNILEYKENK